MLEKIKRVYHEVHIRNRQRAVKRKYAREGLTDEVLEEQVAINRLRNMHDIPDKSNFLFEDYVQ